MGSFRIGPGYRAEWGHARAFPLCASTYTDIFAAASVGYWKADHRSGLVPFPTLQLYPNSSSNCFGNITGYSGAEITVNRKTGEAWAADYCRKRIGRLRKLYCDCCS